jgi:hypothetical protein
MFVSTSEHRVEQLTEARTSLESTTLSHEQTRVERFVVVTREEGFVVHS